MSQQTLQRVVGTAIVDHRFRADFLDGGRRRLLAQFGLGEEEAALLLGIRANTLEEFAAELQRHLESNGYVSLSPSSYRSLSIPVGF